LAKKLVSRLYSFCGIKKFAHWLVRCCSGQQPVAGFVKFWRILLLSSARSSLSSLPSGTGRSSFAQWALSCGVSTARFVQYLGVNLVKSSFMFQCAFSVYRSLPAGRYMNIPIDGDTSLIKEWNMPNSSYLSYTDHLCSIGAGAGMFKAFMRFKRLMTNSIPGLLLGTKFYSTLKATA
jgi:hypothetical protein